MADYGTKMTDRAVRETERRLSRVYREAARDIKSKMKDWEKAHAEREKKYRQQLADGKITQADFDAWMRGQVFQGNQWKARQEQINQILLNADKAAAQIVNEGKMGVFAANANYVGYELERGVGVRTGFNLYDQNTVSRLIRKDPDMLPKAREGVQKDKSYRWYNKQVASAVTQGIVQGEGVREIARRIVDKTSEGNYKSAVRHARTAYTGAQNAGRMEGLHQAQELGINVKKQWVATNDDRTRDTHAELDGQIAEVDEPFITSEGEEIMYPGDPTAAPGEVYNCRCTLVYVYPDYPSDMSDGEPTRDASFEEWEDMKREDEEQEDVSEPDTEYDEATRKFVDGLYEKIDPVEVQELPNPLTPEQIIDRVGGGDKTSGSCASLTLAYAGNKYGYDVLDFRGGKSQEYFSVGFARLSKLPGIDTQVVSSNNSVKAANELLSRMIVGKEYILETGEHAAVVRRTESGINQYLELQQERGNRWKPLNDYVLRERFGAKTRRTVMGLRPDDDSRLIDIDSLPRNPAFKEILSFINTNDSDQKKGKGGYAK